MSLLLQRNAFEKLISQVVFIEENIEELLETASKNRDLPSKSEMRLFLNQYVRRIEQLFSDVKIENSGQLPYDKRLNLLPFVIADSHFRLTGRDNRIFQCQLTRDHIWDRRNQNTQLYFLSTAGYQLLAGEDGQTVRVDIGMGMDDYKISAIRMNAY